MKRSDMIEILLNLKDRWGQNYFTIDMINNLDNLEMYELVKEYSANTNYTNNGYYFI